MANNSKLLKPLVGKLSDASVDKFLNHLSKSSKSYGNPNTEKNSGRKVEVFSIHPRSGLYAEVFGICTSYAKRTGIHVDGFDDFAIMRYGKKDGYAVHSDYIIDQGSNHRKVSFIAQLSHPYEYKGGDVILYVDGSPYQLPRDRGCYVLFPSFMLHEVTSVTSGTRLSSVAWCTGKNWR